MFAWASISAAGVIAQPPAGAVHHEISGIVVSAKSGEPLANTSITAIRSSTGKSVAETLTDATGRFRFSDVPEGKYDLLAARKGYVTSAYQQHDGGINTAIVTGEGLTSTGLLFQLEPQARIYGTILEDSGDPVPAAQVKLLQRDLYRGTGRMLVAREVNADAIGNFEMANLAPGHYVLCVVGTPWYALGKRSFPGMQPPGEENGLARLDMLYAPTCYPDTTDPGEAESITVAPGEQVPLNVSLHPISPTHLSLPIPEADADGRRSINAPQVMADILGTSQFIPTPISFTREDGKVPYTAEIELPPGQYELSFSAQDGEPGRHARINAEAGSSTLTMTASDSDSAVAGTMQAENGEPLAGTSVVRLEPRDSGSENSVAVNPDGTFTFPSVEPGVYSVTASSSTGHALGIAHMSAKGAPLLGHILTLGGGPVQLSMVVRQSNASVNGMVSKNGTPAAGIFVLLVPTGAEQVGDRAMPNQSDSDGTFNFLRVPPGDYTAVAIEDGWKLDWAKADTIKPYLKHGELVRVGPAARDVNLKEPLEPLPFNLRP